MIGRPWRHRAAAVALTLPLAAASGSPPPACGLSGQTNGTTVTYSFAGTLTQPFGTLAVGTPFTGAFSFAAAQPDLSPTNLARGDYTYQSISVTIGGTTVTDNGTGVINVYDGPTTYPTDLFHLYTYNLSGSLGGIALAPGAGIQFVLQNINGTTWNSTALPGAALTLADFTPSVNATFLELQSVHPSGPGAITVARGELTSCCATAPTAAVQALITVINGMGLPQGVKNSLTGPLNATPSCGSMGASVNQVNAKIQNGQLTQAQAAALLLTASTIKTCMGCP